MSEYTEDDLVGAMISDNRDSSSEVIPEAHYNYYGDRGVVDLAVLDDDEGYISLHEVKSASAIQNHETGANSIVRQFNRMRKYFFQDESWDIPASKDPHAFRNRSSTVRFTLDFVACEACLQHVVDNFELYRQSVESDIFDENTYPWDVGIMVAVRMLHPENSEVPIFLYSTGAGKWPREELEHQLSKYDIDSSILSDKIVR